MNKAVNTDLGTQEIFSKNLLKYVEDSGKTQKEVAKVVGVSAGTFCDWIKGRSYPRMDKVQKLADYFGVKKSDLVERKTEGDTKFELQLERLYDLFNKVPEEKREFVLSLIQAAIDNL